MPHNSPVYPTGLAVDDRQLLAKLAAGPLSGDALAQELGQTRAAIWKRIQGLRASGIAIEGRAGDGYTLQAPVDLLDLEHLRSRLRAETLGAIDDLDIRWSVGSTNSELLRCSTPERAVRVLFAERQTQGRGRRGRTWASPLAANLYVSVLRGFPGGLARLAGLSLAAGVAIAEVLRELGLATVGLKWPNDLVAGDCKLGGLLIEGGGEFAGPARAVIGLGLNMRMPESVAAGIDQPWTDIERLAADAGLARSEALTRTAVAAALLDALLPALAQFEEEGLAPFLPRYAALDALAGRAIRAEVGGHWLEGQALGVAEDGALRVRIDGMERSLHAGEVSVRAQ